MKRYGFEYASGPLFHHLHCVGSRGGEVQRLDPKHYERF